jgi:hypothetical protein
MKSYRLTVNFDEETYNQICNYAAKTNTDKAALIRSWSIEALNGKLSSDNIDFITKIIRNELSNVLKPSVERLAALSAKTCIQAGTSAYLSAEAIASLVPPNRQKEVKESFDIARKKAVEYTQKKLEY